MNDLVLLKEQQTAEELFVESANELQRKSSEAVKLDELVKIHVQQLCRDTQMTTEVETLSEIDHAVPVLGILQFVSFRYSQLSK